MTEARAVAKAAGAAQRIAEGVNNLARVAGELPPVLALQVNTLVEEFDLLRFHLREATLHAVIAPAAPVTPAKPKRPHSASRTPAKAKRKGKPR